jgi:hypothetical protein
MQPRKISLCVAAACLSTTFLGETTPTKKTGSTPLTQYTDPAHSVTFTYPSVWKQVKEFEDYSPPAVFRATGSANKIKPAIVIQFTGAGNLYARTDLSVIAFQYGTVANSSPAACSKIAVDISEPATTLIHGVRFRHGSESGGGAGHGIKWDVYTTYRSGVCYVFEEDFATDDVVDHERSLTKSEMKALHRHLDAIMQSVQFVPAP